MKKVLFTAIAVLILLLSGCSSEKTAVIFTTEHIVEDYCEDAIIVSNANGKVYGLLNNKGEEILPLNYDDIEFMNKDEYISGENETLYLCAEYEDEYTVMTVAGKEIIHTSNYIYTMDFELDTEITENTPFFKESAGDKFKFYNEKGESLSYITENSAFETAYWISDKAYCYVNPFSAKITTYNYNGEQINSFDGACDRNVFRRTDEIIFYTAEMEDIGGPYKNMNKLSVNADGQISVVKKYDNYDVYFKELQAEKRIPENKNYNLYESNGTWKLEDWEGNPLYEERYFERLSPSGENDCIGLTDQNDGICIIGSDGTKYVDFGLIYYDEEDETAYMTILEEDEDGEEYEEDYEVKEIFEGRESIIIPIEADEGYDIYYYGK